MLLTLLRSLATREKWLEAYMGPSEGSFLVWERCSMLDVNGKAPTDRERCGAMHEREGETDRQRHRDRERERGREGDRERERENRMKRRSQMETVTCHRRQSALPHILGTEGSS